MEFTLKNSARKTVQLEIQQNGTLLVRAPRGYTRAEAEEFVEKNSAWIEKHMPAVLQRYDAVSALTAEQVKQAKAGAMDICTFLVEKYAPIMQVKPAEIKITGAKKRFGSCSGDNRLCFSYYLMLYPYDAILYVVIHELAHIKHHDHSKAFHQCVSNVLIDAKSFERLLHPSNASIKNLKDNLSLLDKIK